MQSVLSEKPVDLYCESCGTKLTVRFGELLKAFDPFRELSHRCQKCGDTVTVDVSVLALQLGDSLLRDRQILAVAREDDTESRPGQ